MKSSASIAANDAPVAMVELSRRQGHARTNTAKYFFLHQSVRPWVQVALQVAPDLVVLITKSVWVMSRVGIQQQARRLNRPSRSDYYFRTHRMRLRSILVLNDIRYAVNVAVWVRFDSFRYRIGYEFTASCCQGSRNRRVMGASLGVGRAGETNAVFAGYAGATPAVRQSINKQWD
jgi:hypothetical protein